MPSTGAPSSVWECCGTKSSAIWPQPKKNPSFPAWNRAFRAPSSPISAAEVAQVYVGKPGSAILRPAKELKGFAKVRLAEGESRRLTIPLDDCALLGWAAAERQQLAAAIRSHALGSRIYSYSGADEAGCILLARAVNHSRGITPSVHICYSSAGAPMVIPRFEDRPLGENLKWLVAAAGGRTCFSLQEADYILVVNAPTEGQSAMGDAKSPAPHSAFGERCLPDLAANLRALAAKKPVILADLAVTNGADREWMDLLQQQNLLKTLYAYAGWNTAANAAGCCIAQGMLCGKDSTQSALFTCHRILEDWLYMSLVRRDVAAYAQRKGLSFDGSWQEQLLAKYVTRQMCRLAKGLSLPAQVEISQISFPWHRPFEIELFIQLSAPSKAGM